MQQYKSLDNGNIFCSLLILSRISTRMSAWGLKSVYSMSLVARYSLFAFG
jgi:hypothetical protein